MKQNHRCFRIRWYEFDLYTLLDVLYGTQKLQNSKLEPIGEQSIAL